MPLTPLHYSTAYILYRLDERHLRFPALIVGSMTPDLEFPLLYLFNILSGAGGQVHTRLILHSLLGATSLGTLIAAVITVTVYPALINRFTGIALTVIQRRCRFSQATLLSCLLGTFTHVTIDTTHHSYNPILYPFSSTSFDNLVLFGDWTTATLTVQTLFFAALLLIFFIETKRGGSDFWERLLVGTKELTSPPMG